MRVEGYALLETEQDLHGTCAKTHFSGLGNDDLRGILEDVRLGLLVVDVIFHDSLGEHAHELQDFQDSGVADFSSIGHDADHDFLPRARTPGLGSVSSA